jgi:hypothetical protein
MFTAPCSEFALHVHKKPGNADRPDLYTIGVWEGTVLRGICHAQPIDCAVSALRRTLEEAGQSTIVHSS